MHTKTKAIVVLAVLAALGVVYYQYRYYHADVAFVDEGEVELTADGLMKTDGVLHSIPLDEVLTGNPRKDGIPSIDEPVYESVRAADQYLDDNGFGLVVEVGSQSRFYPYQILVWHEIVNDTFVNEPLLVTFCPLCYTGRVFDREVNGEEVEFGTSGKLHNSNLLMYDRWSDSLWSQAFGEAVVGDLTGTALEVYPSLTISWADYKTNYPGGEVLSRETGHDRDYTSDPYGPVGYYESAAIWFPLSHEDQRLHPKAVIFGLEIGEATKAYELERVQEAGSIDDVVGGESVRVYWDEDVRTVRAERTTGESIQLENSFWFSWAATHPETELYE